MLEVKNLTKIYGKDKKAVDDVSIEVKAGEIVGFIGHNGAGKTTAMKSCAGIITIDKGDVLIDGVSIKDNPIACKSVTSFVPDTPNLYGYLTGYQYLNFICDLYNVSQNDRTQKITELADKFELSHALGSLISSYSHGMKQKTSLIAALVHEPKLLILDEPFVALDPKAFITLKSLLAELCANGSAVLFSSHVLDVVEKLCHKLIIIRQGKIIAQGEISEILGNGSLEDVFMELTAK